MEDQKSLTLCWHSSLGGSSNIVTIIFTHKGGQYWNYGVMSLHNPVIIQDTRPTIFGALLRLISRMGQLACQFPLCLQSQPILSLWKNVTMQPFDCAKGKSKNCWRSVDIHLNDILTVIGCATIARKMHIVIIESQYIVSMYNHLHPKASTPPCFWATTTQDIWEMNDVVSSCHSRFGWQLTAYTSIHWFWIYIALRLHLSLYSSFSPLSMTYHKQWSKSETMCTTAERRVMQLDTRINAPWRLSFIRVHIAHWPLLFWLVWHHGLKCC